jgi:hypothetical protein
MSSCLDFARSLSPGMLSCLLAAVFLSQWCYLWVAVPFVLAARAPTLQPDALMPSRYMPTPSGSGGRSSHGGGDTVLVPPRVIISRSNWTCAMVRPHRLLELVLLIRLPPSPGRIL